MIPRALELGAGAWDDGPGFGRDLSDTINPSSSRPLSINWGAELHDDAQIYP